MKVVIIDNYDSFTFNLLHYVEEILQQKVDVFRNDLEDITILDNYSHVILSPGPGIPSEAGRLMEIIDKFYASKKIIGICLGMQALALHFGGNIKQLSAPKHGVQNTLLHKNNSILFTGVPNQFKAGRYHSWCVTFSEVHTKLIATALDTEGNIMALKHQSLPIEALQFHPESILTIEGKKMLENFFSLI